MTAEDIDRLAMKIACATVRDYGEGDEREQEAAKNGTLWGDHPAHIAAHVALSVAAGQHVRYLSQDTFS